jgi:hypothetical protein
MGDGERKRKSEPTGSKTKLNTDTQDSILTYNR